jgi:hypothetical protein
MVEQIDTNESAQDPDMDVGGTLDQLEATLMGIKLQSMIPACGFSYMKAKLCKYRRPGP